MSRSIRVCVIAALLEAAIVPGAATADPNAAAVSQDEEPVLPVLVMLIGGGARFRSIHLELGDGAGLADDRSFETGAYFDFGWHLLVRPMGRRSRRPSVQAIIFQIDGGSGIGLEVGPEATGITLQTNAWRLLGQVGYLYPIQRLQVGGLVGVGGDVLNLDLNSVLPSSRIIYVRVGPAVAYNIIPSFLGLRADFGVRAPFYLGALEDAFGKDSKGIGLDGAVTFDGRLEAGFSYAVRFTWEYYRLRFSGANMNVPAMGDGGDGKDHAFAIQLLLGWSL